jgi:hypothetical protein
MINMDCFVYLKYSLSSKAFLENIEKYFSKNLLYLEGSKDAGLIASVSTIDQAIDKLYSLSMIDNSFVDAMKFAMSGDPTLLELKKMSVNALDSEGAFHWMKGYVGERQVATLLSEQGYVVTFPESSTEKGYDILVDGQKYQVKTTEDTGIISSHLDANPNIPVLVPEELMSTAAVISNDMIVPVSGFSLETANEVTKSSFEELSTLGDLSDSIPIPILTSLIICYKEYLNITHKGKSKVEAAKDVGIGVVSTTVGSAAGGAVGLGIGTAAAAAGVGGAASWGTAAAVGATLATSGKVGTEL